MADARRDDDEFDAAEVGDEPIEVLDRRVAVAKVDRPVEERAPWVPRREFVGEIGEPRLPPCCESEGPSVVGELPGHGRPDA